MYTGIIFSVIIIILIPLIACITLHLLVTSFVSGHCTRLKVRYALDLMVSDTCHHTIMSYMDMF